MNNYLLVKLTAIFLMLNICSQFALGQSPYKDDKSWAIGGGVNNFVMHGDLRSIGTGNQGNFWNFGGYLYVDKMFNPILGLEFKANYYQISGAAQYLSEVYDVLYLEEKQISNNLFFEGRAYGAELNAILCFSNLYRHSYGKLKLTGYFGVGYHQYNSRLLEKLSDGSERLLLDFGNNLARYNDGEASSIYITTQLGIKYRISNRLDLELRPSWYFNYEDHLDAAISNKQDWETFFVTHLGVVFRLGNGYAISEGNNDVRTNPNTTFKILDDDGDGVMNELDREPDTPSGVTTYANGVAVDSDSDGIPDYKDDCRFEFGLPINNGCPKKENPISSSTIEEDSALSKSIYFIMGSNEIYSPYYLTLLDEWADIILRNPNVLYKISGYADDTGSESFNQKLSELRADEARLYLIGKGIEADRILVEGYGELNPKYDNATKRGRQSNRRIEIKSIGSYTKK
ncbi:MAG: OmpA family protein [Bacteroidota bacterium]